MSFSAPTAIHTNSAASHRLAKLNLNKTESPPYEALKAEETRLTDATASLGALERAAVAAKTGLVAAHAATLGSESGYEAAAALAHKGVSVAVSACKAAVAETARLEAVILESAAEVGRVAAEIATNAPDAKSMAAMERTRAEGTTTHLHAGARNRCISSEEKNTLAEPRSGRVPPRFLILAIRV